MWRVQRHLPANTNSCNGRMAMVMLESIWCVRGCMYVLAHYFVMSGWVFLVDEWQSLTSKHTYTLKYNCFTVGLRVKTAQNLMEQVYMLLFFKSPKPLEFSVPNITVKLANIQSIRATTEMLRVKVAQRCTTITLTLHSRLRVSKLFN